MPKTDKQQVVQAMDRIAELKSHYSSDLQVFLSKIETETDDSQKLAAFLQCQKSGNAYFNYAEEFVGNSGLLGAHANGLWVTGFAESCAEILRTLIHHITFLRIYAPRFPAIPLSAIEPAKHAYANLQRMVAQYMNSSESDLIKKQLQENKIPTHGFNNQAIPDIEQNPKWMTISGLAIGVIFLIIILALAVLIPNPTTTQFFIFRGLFSLASALIAAIIPGLLSVRSTFQKMSIRASGAIAIFIIIWQLNPPALIAG